MRISYKKLWILLIEKEISPATLRKDLNIATGTMTKCGAMKKLRCPFCYAFVSLLTVISMIFAMLCERTLNKSGFSCFDWRTNIWRFAVTVGRNREIGWGAKFCHACGASTNRHSHPTKERAQEFAGRIIKCPNCGEVLESFSACCPACGIELRGTKRLPVRYGNLHTNWRLLKRSVNMKS